MILKFVGEKWQIRLNKKKIEPGQTVGPPGSAVDHVASEGLLEAMAARLDFEEVQTPAHLDDDESQELTDA